MTKEEFYPHGQPAQHQNTQPGREGEMTPEPVYEDSDYKSGNRLLNKVALITGGDSGIGRAVTVHYAKEGADVAVVYLEEDEDAQQTKKEVEEEGRRCLLIKGDLRDEAFCRDTVKQTVDTYGKLDILINNAAEQHPQKNFEDITSQQMEKTFQTNVFSVFYMTHAALPFLKEGSSIINTTSVTAYQGNPTLIDYSSTKGALVAFTRSLAVSLASKGIRVNAVAPGPIWTPLIPSTFPEEKVQTFGTNTPMGRAGQPEELAPSYVFLGSDESSYISGQAIHVNGGTIVNG